MRAAVTMMCALLWLGGCAGYGNPYGVRVGGTRAELVAHAGEPVRSWRNADGSETLEYSSQPWGDTTTLITLDTTSRVARVVNAFSEENLARIQQGMTPAEVSALLGSHRSIEYFPLSREEVWDWNIRNPGTLGYGIRFNVHFRDGRMVRTSQTRYGLEPWYPFF